jgi:hypothetical protein
MPFAITRQRYYDDNQLAVEINCGGKMKSGPDVLPIKFKSEGKNLLSPVDAVNASLRIVKEWDHVYFDEKKKIAIVSADGKKTYFNPSEKSDVDSLERWGKKTLAAMKSCDHCGRPIGGSKFIETPDLPNRVFCQEICASNTYRVIYNKELPSGKKK